MVQTPYTTTEYRTELQRVRQARRRNAVLIALVGVIVVAGVTFFAFSGRVI